MGTRESTVEFIIGQLAGVDDILAEKMFGEYGIRCNDKIVALVCDEQLFVKPIASGLKLAGGAAEAPPYPSVKLSLLIGPDRWDNAGWLTTLHGKNSNVSARRSDLRRTLQILLTRLGCSYFRSLRAQTNIAPSRAR